MREIAIAAIGAVAVIAPALISIPYGPRRRILTLHEKVRVLTDLEALSDDGVTTLRKQLRQEIALDLILIHHWRRYGNPVAITLTAACGLAIAVSAVSLMVTGDDPNGAVNRLADIALYATFGLGLALMVGAGARYARTFSLLKSDREELSDRRTRIDSKRQARIASMQQGQEHESQLLMLENEIKQLEIELVLHETVRRRDEIAEKVRALRNPEPAPTTDTPDASA